MADSGFKKTVVPGEGDPRSNIYLIGEGPGGDEEKYGRPFVGPAGRELDRILGAAGIERRSCYVDNIVRRRPFGDKNKAFHPAGPAPSMEFAEGIAHITDLIREHRPNVVVAIGSHAMWGLTLLDSITTWQGSIVEAVLIPGQKILPVLHPSYIMRGMWHLRTPTIWYFMRARREATFSELDLPVYDWVVAKPEGPFTLDMAREEILDADYVVPDLETFGGRNLACMGYGLSSRRAIVVPHTGPTTIQFYKETLETSTPKGGQNLMSDFIFMACVHDVRIRNIDWDTMLASHTMYPDLPKGLDNLCTYYTRQPYYKSEGKVWKRTHDLNRFWQYNATDCCTEFEIIEAQRAEVDEFKARETAEFMASLIEPYGEATVLGMGIDRGLMDRMAEEKGLQSAELQGVLEGTIGHELNVRSDPQVKDFVYNELKLPKRYKKRALTVEKKVLLDLAAKTGSSELKAVVKIRSLRHFVSSNATPKILDIDGRFRCNFKLGGTKSSRLSSSSTLWGAGTNQQNFPDEARKFIIADPGTSFVVLDLQQAESTVVAFLCEDELEMMWFHEQLDAHKMLAALIFNKEPEDIIFGERYLAKHCHHGLNYMMYPRTFTLRINEKFQETGVTVTEAEATAIRIKYLALRPALPLWWDKSANIVRETGKLITVVRSEIQPEGRTRYFMGKWTDRMKSDIIYYVPQASVGDVSHHCTLRYWQDEEMREMRKAGQIGLLNQLHDGLTFQIKDDMIDELAPKLMKMSLVDLEAHGRKFVVPVDVSVGKSWDRDSLKEYGTLRAA